MKFGNVKTTRSRKSRGGGVYFGIWTGLKMHLKITHLLLRFPQYNIQTNKCSETAVSYKRNIIWTPARAVPLTVNLFIVMAFLTERELILRYKGKSSGRKYLPGGSPQETQLSMFLFQILINFTGFDSCDLQKHIESVITKPLAERKPILNSHMKYIVDLSYVRSMDLKKCLKLNTDENLP
jgi:hypothetical protein